MIAKHFDFRFAVVLSLAALVGAAALVPARAQRPADSAACSAPAGLMQFSRPLNRVARRLNAGEPVKIVAIGSSSTAGAGASTDAATYPSRLAVELKARFPRQKITVVNHGVNGTEVGDILTQFDESVVAEKPDLVLWQLGTNSLLRDRTLSQAAKLIDRGLHKLKAIGTDIVLVNPQYAPKVLAKSEADHMLQIISAAANQANVNLFDRFGVMRHWQVAEKLPFSTFLSSDELHMNDWSYACIAKILGGAIADAAVRPAQTVATAAPHD
jgi:lysophospholipase L1-like esterase